MFSRWRGVLLPSLLRSSVVAALVIVAVGAAHAGTLDVSWTAPTSNEDGSPLTDLASYRVYYGSTSTPCPGSSYSEFASPSASPAAGDTVVASLTGLTAGVTYYVSVTAVDGSGNESPCLTPVGNAVARSGFSISPTGMVDFGSVAVGGSADRTFTLQSTGAETVSGSASIPSGPFTVVSGSPFTLSAGATQTMTVRFAPTVAATATSNVTFATTSAGTLSGTVTGTGTAATAGAPPAVSITALSGSASLLTITGKASDSSGVSSVTWTNDSGARGTATGTTSWKAYRVPLQPGSNLVTVTASDTAGATATASVQVISTPPALTTTSLSASGSLLTITGKASSATGVTRVTWTNGNGGSGTAIGTTSWKAARIPLQRGSNVVTITVWDATGPAVTGSVQVDGWN
jgi:hypothetical protein